MHIGIDGSLLYGSFSGVEQAIYRLLRELSRDGGPRRYTVYVPSDFAHEDLAREGFRLRRLGFPGAAKLRRVLWTQMTLHRLARAEGVDLLHGPGYVLPPRWQGPSVATVYDIIALTHPELCTRSNALYYRACLPRTIAQATVVVVPSEAVKREIVRTLGVPEGKLKVAPLGVGEEFLAPTSPEAGEQVRERLGLRDPYFLCVGNFEPKKNLAATIEAFRLAKRRADLPHRLVLAGGKAWRSRGVEQAIEAAGPNVILRTGYVAPEELPALYAGAEALLFWSLVEGFGLPALEAMACGTPVICSDRGALPEVVGDAAVIVPIGDPADLAEAIGALAADADRRADLATRGRLRAAPFTWRRHADAVLRAYDDAGWNPGTWSSGT
ncbi:MAG: glycosyltransferase family 4 protein [Armatimonadetes bacterium]|nr:glycosyltransferase family 4 protein [Armatimonadota bacterium]